MQRATLFIIALWLMALTLAGWTLAQLPLHTISQQIKSLSLLQWVLWLSINGSIIILLTLRWQLLCRAVQAPITLLSLFCIRLAGNTVSFITPGPQFGGEPLQLYWLHQYGMPLRRALLSLGLDRFLELWINFSVLLAAALLLLLGQPAQGLSLNNWQTLIVPLLMMLGLMLALAAIIIKQPQWIHNRLAILAQRWQYNPRLRNIHGHWQTLGDDLRRTLTTQKSALYAAIMLSLLSWAGLIGELYFILHMLKIDVELHGFLLIIIALRMALLLPMPGGIGTIEAALLWAFNSLQLPVSAAIGVIALMRLRDAIILIAGLLCLRIQTAKK